MASLTFDDKGARIRVVGTDNRRHTIRLEKMPKSAAIEIKGRIEALAAANKYGRSPDKNTASWLASIDDSFHRKLANSTLVAPRENKEEMNLADFLNKFIGDKKDIKENTKRNLINSKNKLIKYFGENKKLTRISCGDADDWRQDLVNKKYSNATISKAVKHAKQFFRHAVRKKHISSNPFEDVRAGGERNDSRLEFIDRERIQKVIDKCPDNEWKLIVALSRYGGLRCPSEHLALTWDCINWAEDKITVPSSKTEHHNGKGERIVPLFPELKPYLEAVWDEAKEGATYVITRYRDTNSNLRTQFHRIIKRASVTIWERLFHNLRASRQIELADEFPAHVVSDWIGNSPQIAERHYLKTTEAHFKRAVGSAEQQEQEAKTEE